jgi:hypothetical protein
MRWMAILMFAAGLVATSPSGAADPWNLKNESAASFRAKVVDIGCELAKDCPPACGGGKRPLGLLAADGKLYAAIKGTSNFAGPMVDLAPHCGKEIFVDGLLISSPQLTMYMVQYLREKESDPWQPTTAFRSDWTARNGKAEYWYLADPDIKAIIAQDGKLGLGPNVLPKPK